MKHLSDKAVERFLCGWTAREEHRWIVHHLLKGCRRCSLRLAPFTEVLFAAEELPEQGGGTVTAFYDRALERAAAKALRYEVRHGQEKARLDRAIAVAKTCAPEELIQRKEIKALRGPTRVEALLRFSFEERYRNPAQMLLLALAAKAAAELLKRSQHGSALVADLQAQVWMEGKVLAGRGSLGRAEQIFEEVREEFFWRGREYDAALVGLELAAVWLQQGRTAEVLEVAEETTETLRELGVYKEAYKASCFLRAVCRRNLATVDLLREVHEFLTRLQWQPHLRFARLR